MAHENVHYPPDPLLYKLLVEIGRGVSAIVYKARCVPMNSLVAIKAIDLDQSRADIDCIRREATTMSLLSHTNILRAHCSFTVNRRLWVVMPFMSAGSLQSIISTSFPDGLPESCIAVVLKETLNALQYLHDQGHLHRDIKAGNILLDSDGSVKLADFGVSASIYESNLNCGSSSSSTLLSPSMRLSEITGTPYWMAPEVIHSHTGYSFKADIWSFGITALELAHGRPPLSHLPPSQSLMMKMTKRFRFSDYQKNKNEKNFSKAFKAMVKSCLDQDPSRRPTAESLLKHPFFKKCKGSDFLVKTVLQGLPSVEDRFKLRNQPSVSIVKGGEVDEEEDENDEGSSQGGYTRHRRISGWNFNEEGFELDPVFPSEIDHHPEEAVIKQVRFGGETIIQDMEEMEEEEETEVGPETSEASPAEVTEEEPQVGTHVIEALGGWNFMGAQDGVAANNEVIIPGLESLLQSLYVQRQQVRSLLGRLRGGEEVVQEVTREEKLLHEIERLGKELENEKQKSFSLEMELQFLKLQMSGGASSGGESGSSSGAAAGH